MTSLHLVPEHAGKDPRAAHADGRDALAALVASRLCHDLIGPIAAVGNGLELAALSDGAAEDMELVEEAATAAADRIRFFRIAFGRAAGQPVDAGELGEIAQAFLAGQRIRLVWRVSGPLPREEARLILLALMLAAGVVARNGAVEASASAGKLSILAAAPRRRDMERYRSLLDEGAPLEGLTPAEVHIPLLALGARAAGYALTLCEDAEGFGVTLSRRD